MNDELLSNVNIKNIKFTETEVLIFNRLQQYINMSEDVSLAKLASECHVAPSTIIKMAHKMGYSGFVELKYQLKSSKTKVQISQPELMSNIIIGDGPDIMNKLVSLIADKRGNKNIIHISNDFEILGNYISRKLGFFDIFAPATYDYSMANNLRMERGFIIFPDTRNQIDYLLPMLKLTKEKGYTIIAFGEERNDFLEANCEIYIQINKTQLNKADLYSVKMIVFFEQLLSRLAKVLGEVNYEE